MLVNQWQMWSLAQFVLLRSLALLTSRWWTHLYRYAAGYQESHSSLLWLKTASSSSTSSSVATVWQLWESHDIQSILNEIIRITHLLEASLSKGRALHVFHSSDLIGQFDSLFSLYWVQTLCCQAPDGFFILSKVNFGTCRSTTCSKLQCRSQHNVWLLLLFDNH